MTRDGIKEYDILLAGFTIILENDTVKTKDNVVTDMLNFLNKRACIELRIVFFFFTCNSFLEF